MTPLDDAPLARLAHLERLPLPPDRQGAVFLHRATATRPMAERQPRGHRHPEVEVNLVTAGGAAYVIDGRRVEIVADTLLWLWPSQGHLLLNRTADFEMWVAVWRPELVRATAQADALAVVQGCEANPDSSTILPRRLGEEEAQCLAELMGRLSDEAPREALPLANGHHTAGLAWLLRECWASFCAADDVPTGSRLHPAVETAARWLAQHAHEPVANDLDALAAKSGLSRWRLSRLFAKQTGVTLVQYRQKRRLEHARRLLGRSGADRTPGRLTLTQAALAAGFGSYAQFYRTHVTHLGCAPRNSPQARPDA